MRAHPSRSRPPRPAAQHAAQHGAQHAVKHGARALELEDWLNRRLYHPASWRLAQILARTPVTPNAVSVMAGACVVGAAMLYAVSSAPGAMWAALGLMMAWHVVDGADGDLARMTGRASALGEIVDGACDYLSHFVLYAVLAVIMAREWGIGGFVVMGAVGCVRAIQTVFYETQRRQYLWWRRGVTWLRIAVQSSDEQPPALQWAARCYLAFARLLAGGGEHIDTALARIAPDRKPDAHAVIEQR
ncbi:MAG: CDP-alcohol phosphatidyltransferase family protein, partial [Pseudomonadota bacterium]